MGVHYKPRSRPGTPLKAGVQQTISGQGQWDVEIMDLQQKVSLWLGTFDTAEDADKAYDEAARTLRSASARTNFQLPGGRQRAGFSEDGEPFSFEVCGIEEPDTLLGALKAKLSDENNSNAVFHAKQQKQKQNINLLQLPHNFIDLSWSLPHASSKISNVGSLRMSDCSRGIKRNSDGRQV